MLRPERNEKDMKDSTDGSIHRYRVCYPISCLQIKCLVTLMGKDNHPIYELHDILDINKCNDAICVDMLIFTSHPHPFSSAKLSNKWI
jgi:hypothetical protein